MKATTSDIFGAGTNFSPVHLQSGATFSPVSDIINATWSPRWDIAPEKQGASGPLTLLSINLSGNTFVYSAGSSPPIGLITVATSGGAFAGTLSLSGANTGGFVLSNPSGPTSNLTCDVGSGCPAAGGPFTDLSIVATQGGAVGNPLTQPETITGSTPPPTVTNLRVRWGLSLP